MFTSQYDEHIASQPDDSRWDGFDRGDTDFQEQQGSCVIGRMTSESGSKVVITEHWFDGRSGAWSNYTVSIDGALVHDTDDRANAITVARWWMAGCPA
jgi:hypothetical protein